ncbi:MAG: GNAT family N-acetyltransferase [Thermoplasmata archaeon]
MEKDLILSETHDFDSIRALSLRSGLEDGSFEHIVKAYGFFSNNRMVGCVALKVENGVYSVDWLAVESGMRGKGLGSALVRRVEEEAKMRGCRKLYTVARAPVFFEKLGFRIAASDDSDGPTMSNCQRCPQYLKSCFPAIVVKSL